MNNYIQNENLNKMIYVNEAYFIKTVKAILQKRSPVNQRLAIVLI